jgi:hypothetical protein
MSEPLNPTDRRISDELRATLAAYHEHGPAYEQQVIDSFLERVRPVIQPSPAPFVPQPRMRGRRRSSGRGLLIGLAILVGWLAIFGHGRPHISYGWRVGPDGSGSPFAPPGISAPAQPAGPQLPSSSIQ